MNSFILKQLPAAILLATSAHNLQALGLGDMHLQSALGEPLSATLHLLEAENLTTNEIIVELADESAYRTLSVERLFSHEKIRFEKIMRDGKVLISLHSDKPLREPFLNIVVAIRWPKGHVLKEYTVLLDPPTIEHSEKYRSIASSVQKGNNRQNSQSSSNSSVNYESERVVADVKKSVQPQAQKTARVQRDDMINASTYQTRSGDSLWAVSNRIKMNINLPIAQIANAVYQHNPAAFIKADPAKMKVAMTLRIPDKQQVLAVANRMPVHQRQPQPRTQPQYQPQQLADTSTTDYDIRPVIRLPEEESIDINTGPYIEENDVYSAPETIMPEESYEFSEDSVFLESTGSVPEVTLLRQENSLLRERIVELELLSVKLQSKLDQMANRVDALSSVEPEYIGHTDVALEIAEVISASRLQSSPEVFSAAGLAIPPSVIGESRFRSFMHNSTSQWTAVSSMIVLLLVLSAFYVRMRFKKVQESSNMRSEDEGKKPFWDMPRQDLTHLTAKGKNTSMFNRPELASVQES